VTPRGGRPDPALVCRSAAALLDRLGTRRGVAQVTRDGDQWTPIDLPPELGAPTDLIRFRGALVVLTERALLSLGTPA